MIFCSHPEASGGCNFFEIFEGQRKSKNIFKISGKTIDKWKKCAIIIIVSTRVRRVLKLNFE